MRQPEVSGCCWSKWRRRLVVESLQQQAHKRKRNSRAMLALTNASSTPKPTSRLKQNGLRTTKAYTLFMTESGKQRSTKISTCFVHVATSCCLEVRAVRYHRLI